MKRAVFWLALCLTMAGPVEAQQVQQVLNEIRADHGKGPVMLSDQLEQAAMAHASDMLRNGFFGHTGSDGSDLLVRVRRQGYHACFIAENIARSRRDLVKVMRDWMNSPGHRRNLLRADLANYGLARAQGGIWVLVLGRDGC